MQCFVHLLHSWFGCFSVVFSDFQISTMKMPSLWLERLCKHYDLAHLWLTSRWSQISPLLSNSVQCALCYGRDHVQSTGKYRKINPDWTNSAAEVSIQWIISQHSEKPYNKTYFFWYTFSENIFLLKWNIYPHWRRLQVIIINQQLIHLICHRTHLNPRQVHVHLT